MNFDLNSLIKSTGVDLFLFGSPCAEDIWKGLKITMAEIFFLYYNNKQDEDTSLINWLILTAYQPAWGYFIPRS